MSLPKRFLVLSLVVVGVWVVADTVPRNSRADPAGVFLYQGVVIQGELEVFEGGMAIGEIVMELPTQPEPLPLSEDDELLEAFRTEFSAWVFEDGEEIAMQQALVWFENEPSVDATQPGGTGLALVVTWAHGKTEFVDLSFHDVEVDRELTAFERQRAWDEVAKEWTSVLEDGGMVVALSPDSYHTLDDGQAALSFLEETMADSTTPEEKAALIEDYGFYGGMVEYIVANFQTGG